MSVATPTSTPAATPAATDANSGAATRASAKAASLSLVTVLAVALILGGFATLAWVTRTPGVTHSNDDALYMLLGDQLTHFSYRELFKVGAPRHGQYPPLWPALLGLTQLLTGGSETARFLLVTVLMTAALALFFDLCRRLLPQWLAVVVLLGAACNPFTINFGGRVMSEAAFLFWSMLCLWALQRARGHETSRRFLRLAAGAALAAALTRTIGLTLLAGVICAWLLERRWRPAFTLSGVTAVFVGGWLAWTLLHHEGVAGRSYVADAAQVTQDRSVGLGTSSPVVAMARKVALRVRLQLTDLVPSGLVPHRRGDSLDNVVWLAVTLLLGAFGAAAYWRLLPSAILYVVFYCGLLSVWPWAPRRFFVPLQPIVLLGFVLGVLELKRIWRPMARYGQLVAAALVAVVLSASVPQVFANARQGLAMRSGGALDVPCLLQRRSARLLWCGRLCARLAPRTARFLVEREAAFAYHTRRIVQHAQAPLHLSDPDFRAYLAKAHIEYIVLSRLTESEVLGVAPKLLSNCEYLAPVRRFAPTGRIYRVLSVSAPAFENACADLSRLQALPQ
ncbi:MAG: glycosyltransferase family 39 protein [Gemmatimonadetes bacterium]|nr:glycosyltransferase family 39 protein [Gemmatimonadota bacterium]